MSVALTPWWDAMRLRREIISTCLSNRLVNLAGPVFVARMKEMSGANGAHVARAHGLAAQHALIFGVGGDGNAVDEIRVGALAPQGGVGLVRV